MFKMYIAISNIDTISVYEEQSNRDMMISIYNSTHFKKLAISFYE